MVAFILSDENIKFKLFRYPDWKVSPPKFGSRPAICGPLLYSTCLLKLKVRLSLYSFLLFPFERLLRRVLL